MRASRARNVGVAGIAAFLLAACGGSGGGGPTGAIGAVAPTTPELVSFRSEANSDRVEDGITVSASATFPDGSYVCVGTYTGGAGFGVGETGERWTPADRTPGAYIARRRADGTFAWVRFCLLRNLGGVDFAPSDVIALADGTSIFTGRRTEGMYFESTSGGTRLDRGDFGSYTAAYDAEGNLRFAREALSAAWDAKLAPAEGGSAYAMVVSVQNEIGIAPDEGLPAQYEALTGRVIAVARFTAATGNYLGWSLLDVTSDAGVACGSTPDGGFAVGGSVVGDGTAALLRSQTPPSGYVVAFDGKSQVRWSRRITATGGARVDALEPTSGGGLVVTGTYLGGADIAGARRTLHLVAPAGAVHRFVCGYDAVGEPLWARDVADLDFRVDTAESDAVSLAVAADGSIALLETHTMAITLDPGGAAVAVPAADAGTSAALFARWSPTGALTNVVTLARTATPSGADVFVLPDGGWRLFATCVGGPTYDPAGSAEATAPGLGAFSPFTLRLRTP